MTKTNFDLYLEEQLKDPEFTQRYEEAGRQWDIALQIACHRLAAGFSQSELARRVGTTQQQISRLEQPDYEGSLTTMRRVAEALDAQLEIRLVPRNRGNSPKPSPSSARAIPELQVLRPSSGTLTVGLNLKTKKKRLSETGSLRKSAAKRHLKSNA